MERITGLPTLLRNGRLRRAVVGSLVVITMLTVTPISLRSVGALEQQRVTRACSTTADAIVGASKSGQLITVTSSSMRSQNATLEFFVRQGGCFRLVDGPYPALLGLNGLSVHHREGDDTTPTGLFAFQSTMYGVLPNPGVAYSYHRLVCGDWWDEQSSSPLYNHFVHVRCRTKPIFGGDSEALWESVPSYDYFAVIAYNRHPIVPGKGSAIFLHVSSGRPTAGCVSIPLADLVRVLRGLRPNMSPLIDISAR
jgi:L,D-peptidoglycan transpeptidase YkuD (ErfK/YbiS/YcfS/YnhG family)